MPATHAQSRDPIPFDVQALFGGSKKTVQRFTLTPHLQHVATPRPGSPAGLLPLCSAPCGAQTSRLLTVLVAEGGGEAQEHKWPELSEGPGKQGCSVAFQRGRSRAGRAWLTLACGDRPSQCLQPGAI